MHLVDDDDLAGQSQVAHGQVRGAHRPEEQVVHGGDDEVRQHRLLAPVEPGQDGQIGPTPVLGGRGGVRRCGAATASGLPHGVLIAADVRGARAAPDGALLIRVVAAERAEEAVADLVAAVPQRPGLLVQPRAPVQELRGEGRGRAALGVGVLDPRQPVDFAGEHGVGRGLGGQGEQDAGAAGAGGEHLGGHEGGLGLAAPRGLLDDEQARQFHGAGRRERARLDVGGAGPLGQVEAVGEQRIGVGAVVAGPPRRGDLQAVQAGGRAGGVGLDREQAGAVVVEVEQGEVGLGRGDPVRHDDQSRQFHEEGLGPLVLRPLGQQGAGLGAPGDEVEEFAAGRVPGSALAEEVLASAGVGGQGRRRGRDAVVGADDGGQGLGGVLRPAVLVPEPRAHDEVAGQGVRHLVPFGFEDLGRLVVQSRLLHAVVPVRDLDGEGRGALSDVVDAGDPGGEEAEFVRWGQARRRARELALDEVAGGGRQPGPGEVLGHGGGVEQVQPQGEPVAALGVVAELGPHGAGAGGQCHRGRSFIGSRGAQAIAAGGARRASSRTVTESLPGPGRV